MPTAPDVPSLESISPLPSRARRMSAGIPEPSSSISPQTLPLSCETRSRMRPPQGKMGQSPVDGQTATWPMGEIFQTEPGDCQSGAPSWKGGALFGDPECPPPAGRIPPASAFDSWLSHGLKEPRSQKCGNPLDLIDGTVPGGAMEQRGSFLYLKARLHPEALARPGCTLALALKGIGVLMQREIAD